MLPVAVGQWAIGNRPPKGCVRRGWGSFRGQGCPGLSWELAVVTHACLAWVG